MYACTHASTDACMYTGTPHSRMHACAHALTHTHMHACTCACIRTHARLHVCTHICAIHAHVCTHAHMHACTPTRTHQLVLCLIPSRKSETDIDRVRSLGHESNAHTVAQSAFAKSMPKILCKSITLKSVIRLKS
jgi:hypothetical protein